MNEKMTFALFCANRGFFPGEVIADAREEMKRVLIDCGYGYICMDESLTRYCAVETIKEGNKYADFLKENRAIMTTYCILKITAKKEYIM